MFHVNGKYKLLLVSGLNDLGRNTFMQNNIHECYLTRSSVHILGFFGIEISIKIIIIMEECNYKKKEHHW